MEWLRGITLSESKLSKTYLGMKSTTGELIVVKEWIFDSDPAKSKEKEKTLQNIERYIDVLEKSKQINIVEYFCCAREDNYVDVFLEYLSGGSIQDMIRMYGKLEESLASSWTRQILHALSHLHRRGIIHGAVTPSHLLIDLEGVCKLSGFSSAICTDAIYTKSPLPLDDDYLCPMRYRSPEMARERVCSGKADVWALGCTILEAVSGYSTWSDEVAARYLIEKGYAPPVPKHVASAISPQALAFLYDCFTTDDTERPTAETLLRAPFCFFDRRYNFQDSELYSKLSERVAAAENEHDW